MATRKDAGQGSTDAAAIALGADLRNVVDARPETVGNQFGYVCPKCKKGNRLRIAARVWVTLLPDGTDNNDSDTEWDNESAAACLACNWTGLAGELEEL